MQFSLQELTNSIDLPKPTWLITKLRSAYSMRLRKRSLKDDSGNHASDPSRSPVGRGVRRPVSRPANSGHSTSATEAAPPPSPETQASTARFAFGARVRKQSSGEQHLNDEVQGPLLYSRITIPRRLTTPPSRPSSNRPPLRSAPPESPRLRLRAERQFNAPAPGRSSGGVTLSSRLGHRDRFSRPERKGSLTSKTPWATAPHHLNALWSSAVCEPSRSGRTSTTATLPPSRIGSKGIRRSCLLFTPSSLRRGKR